MLVQCSEWLLRNQSCFYRLFENLEQEKDCDYWYRVNLTSNNFDNLEFYHSEIHISFETNVKHLISNSRDLNVFLEFSNELLLRFKYILERKVKIRNFSLSSMSLYDRGTRARHNK